MPETSARRDGHVPPVPRGATAARVRGLAWRSGVRIGRQVERVQADRRRSRPARVGSCSQALERRVDPRPRPAARSRGSRMLQRGSAPTTAAEPHRPGRRRSRAARQPPAASTPGSCGSSRRMSASPSAPPSSATTRLEARGPGRSAMAAGGDVRQVGHEEVGPAEATGQRVERGRPPRKSIRSARPWETAFSSATAMAVSEMSLAEWKRDGVAVAARGAARAPWRRRWRRCRCPRPRPGTARRVGGRGARRQAAADASSASSTSVSVSGRGMSTRRSTTRAAP